MVAGVSMADPSIEDKAAECYGKLSEVIIQTFGGRNKWAGEMSPVFTACAANA